MYIKYSLIEYIKILFFSEKSQFHNETLVNYSETRYYTLYFSVDSRHIGNAHSDSVGINIE